jgi:DNA/RNA-binding domain of Phe-tRNA-synthetase-like protein
LVCLFDANGPCGNAVKDSQRTKTTDDTRRTVSVVWGCAGFESQLAAALDWYQALLEKAGVRVLRIVD